MASKGYFKLTRGWCNTDGISTPKAFCEPMAWLWLIENAAHHDTHWHNAKGELIAVARGQLMVSKRMLAAAWGWSNNRVDGFLSRLERVQKIGQSKGQSGTLLTIENYEEFYDSGPASQPASGPASRPAVGQPAEEQKEKPEQKKNISTHPKEKHPPIVPPEKKAPSRGSQWRGDDQVPNDWIEWAMEERGWSRRQAQTEGTRFVDSAMANGRTYKDWRAAWRQWCRSPYQKTEGAKQAALHL